MKGKKAKKGISGSVTTRPGMLEGMDNPSASSSSGKKRVGGSLTASSGSENATRPAFLWDAEVECVAKELGNLIRERERRELDERLTASGN